MSEELIKSKRRKKKQEDSNSDDDDDDTSSPFIDIPPLETAPAIPMNPIPHPLDPLLAKYIRLKPDVTKGIEREYQVTITAADVGVITISPTPTSPPDWPEKAIEMMHDVISSSLTKIDMPVPPEVSGTVYPMVMKACNDEGLQYAFGHGSNKVAIAGHVDAVMKLQHDVNEMCSRMIKTTDDTSPFKDLPPLETASAIPMNPIPHPLDPLLTKYDLLKSKEKEMEDKKREFHQKMEEKKKEVLVLQEKDAKKDREIQQLCLLLKQREKDEEQEIQRYRRQLQEKERELQEAVHICQQQVLTDDHWVINKDEVILTEEELGRGSYATVKVGVFRGLRVAVKSLHTIIISNYNLALFSREMIVASRVRHPNLIQFIGATKVGNPLILTELMSTSLHKELQKKQFTKQQIVSIGQDVALGLNYLHLFKPQPIIHRDVSSPNVLLKPCIGPAGYEAKVADYGTAKLQKGISSS